MPGVTEAVTFLLTELVGSAERWDRDEAGMVVATRVLDRIVCDLVAEHRGTQVKPRGEGDSYFLVFDDPVDAVGCAVALQHAVEPLGLPLRSACHIGPAEFRGGDWYGTTVNRTARLRAAANGGQALASSALAAAVGSAVPADVSLRSLGIHRLKDIDEPTEVFQLCAPGLRDDHPPLATLAQSHGLPLPESSFVGRESECDEIVSLLRDERLVVVTGTPGVGTTRLALEAAAAWWEIDGRPLAAMTDPAGAEVVGARLSHGNDELRGPAVASGRALSDLAGAVVVRVPPLGPLDAQHLLQDRLPPEVSVPAGLVDSCCGLPLAIELLARRAGSLGADVLAERLAADPLAVLGGNRRADPPRHTSMRATFAAAVDDLAAEDRELPLVAAFLAEVARR
jgi:class 3 adenylate cyclase